METNDAPTFTAFAGHRCIVAAATIDEAITQVKRHDDGRGSEPVLIFDDRTGRTIDFDLRGSVEEALGRLDEHPLFAETRSVPKKTGPGRPKLGVISREVSLLPRHWEWLEGQRGGISASLRTLVEQARKRGQSRDMARRVRESAGAFMWTVAGNFPNFEEASRALYAKDEPTLGELIRAWPVDVRRHILGRVAEAARLDAEADAQAAASGAGRPCPR